MKRLGGPGLLVVEASLSGRVQPHIGTGQHVIVDHHCPEPIRSSRFSFVSSMRAPRSMDWMLSANVTLR